MHHVALVIFAALGIDRRRFSPGAFWAVVVILAAWSIAFAAASWDYHGYLVYFQCANTARCDAPSFGTVETSLTWLSRLIAFVFGDDGGPVLVAVYSVTAVTIKLTVLRRQSSAFGIALFAYLCYGFFVHEMTQVRVGLAIAFLWLAMLDWVQPRRKTVAIIWFVLAFFIHNSAILAAGVPFLARIRPTLPRALLVLCVASIFGRLIEQDLPSNVGLLNFALVGRFGAYLADVGNDISRVPQLSIYIAGLITIVFASLIGTKIEEWTRIERMALNSVIGGLTLFLALYWFAVIGQRAMEMLTSPFPIVVSATWDRTPHLIIRIIIFFSLTLIFYNLAVRNGVMKDFVLDGTAQYMRIMQGAVN